MHETLIKRNYVAAQQKLNYNKTINNQGANHV